MSEYEGAGGYLKFVIRRQPEEMRPLLEEAARLVRLEGWTNGYAIVQAWAIEIIATYGPLHPVRSEAEDRPEGIISVGAAEASAQGGER